MYSHSFNDKYEQKPVDVSRFASVVATEPASTVSSRYKFIPTTEALKVLAEYGWNPVQATEARVRLPEKRGFQKHALRLVNEQFNKQMVVGSTVPQLMLTNSHAGTSAFELSLSLFEKVCANGLCVARSSTDWIKIRHFGYSDLTMAEAVESAVKGLPEVLHTTDLMKTTILNYQEQLAFARAAIELRFDGEKYSVEPGTMLVTSRAEEKKPTLWNTFNIVQEKVIKGNIPQIRADNSRIRSREVKSVDENIRLNRALWTLAEEMRKLKA